MNDVARLILEAWEKLGPKIMADPEELARRLARRRSALMTRPPRAWCLAIRASDRRITPAHWVISPEHAMDLDHPAHPYEPIEHEVIIRPHALRKFCRAVRTSTWGEEVADVAKQLGVHRASGLSRARLAGLFTEKYVKGLGGKRGKPVPLIHSRTTLDPSGAYFQRCDPLWGSLWEFLPDMIPDGFEQTVVRRPVFTQMRCGRKGVAAYGRDIPEGHKYREEMQLIGWRWVCPACKKEVRKIYYPVAPQTVFDFLGYDPGRGSKSGRRACAAPKKFLRYDAEQLEGPPGSFACTHCHGIHSWSRVGARGWNQVVSHLTRGMLYGHEVERPQWYRSERKRARHRQLRGRPAVKREGVFEGMKRGLSIEEIALEMEMTKNAVVIAMSQICRQERVKNRRELAAKLGWKAQQPLNAREKWLERGRERAEVVEGLLLEGLSYKEIALRTGMGLGSVKVGAVRIYKKHGVSGTGRRGLGRKFGVELKRFGGKEITKGADSEGANGRDRCCDELPREHHIHGVGLSQSLGRGFVDDRVLPDELSKLGH